MKWLSSNKVTVGLAVAALAVSALVVRRELQPASAAASIPPPAARDVLAWEKLAEGRILGNPSAPIRIIEFSDFTCGYCKGVRPEMERLRVLDPQRISIVYRHYAREQARPHAFAAAMAAECAGDQGRFTEYHDALFADQASIGKKSWSTFAQTVRVPDLRTFQQCVVEQRHRARVERDTRIAEEIGAPGTPAFVFDGKLIMGVDAPARLEPLVRKALAVR